MKMLFLICEITQRLIMLQAIGKCDLLKVKKLAFYVGIKSINCFSQKRYNFQLLLFKCCIWFLCKTNLARLSLNGVCSITR